MKVRTGGLYELTAAALDSIGFDLAQSEPSHLRLMKDDGSVPFQLVGAGATTSLRFFGVPPSKASYSADSIYWLINDESSEQAMVGETIPTRQAAPASQAEDVALATLHLEEQRQVSSKIGPDVDRWFWRSLVAPDRMEVAFDAPGATGRNVRISTRLWGNTSAPQDPDHHVLLVLNGTAIGEMRWDGVGAYGHEVTVPPGQLTSNDNRLEIELVGDTGAPVDGLLIDWVDVSYERELTLQPEKALHISSGDASALVIRVANSSVGVWDITHPESPTSLAGFQESAGTITFASGPAGSDYFIFDTSALAAPEAMIPADSFLTRASALQNWPGGADLIVITVPAFHEALVPLLAAREAEGLRVALIDVEDVYAAFSAGQPTPAAIRALVQRSLTAWDPPAPRYLLLAGDASYDSRDYLQGIEQNLVPTQLVDTTFTGWTASDVWFALPYDEPTSLPEMAVGRLPAQTVEQMTAMVEKTLRYAQEVSAGTAAEGPETAWRRNVLLLADNDDPGFALVASDFGSRLEGYSIEQVEVAGDGTSARTYVLDAFSRGVGLVGYFGHGSVGQWAQEKVFSVDDAARLRNEERTPLLLTVTCLSGFFQHPEVVSLGEAMVRQARGGVVAGLVPSSAGILTDQQLLSERIAGALASARAGDGTLGDLLLASQRALPITADGIRQTMLTFNLLGDPSMRFP